MMNPTIYVVLPVHNRINITKDFIGCLKRQTYKNYHLILVDDGSTDGTAEYVKQQIDNLTVLYGDGNLWWAGSLSKAYGYLSKIKADDTDIVLIGNDDTTFDSDYFDKVINDRDLKSGTLVVSPGHSISSDFTSLRAKIERGFAIDWPSLRVYKLEERQEPDAVTTRGLYMHYATYKSLGPLHPWLLPHYLSDLEYTIRAKRRGFRLIVSSNSHLYVDRSITGSHHDDAKTLKEFLFNHLVSKKTAYNTFYWGNFVLLAAPWKYKFKAFRLVYIRFYRKLTKFVKEIYLAPRELGTSK
jgi:GT2 family glycosyltransferase